MCENNDGYSGQHDAIWCLFNDITTGSVGTCCIIGLLHEYSPKFNAITILLYSNKYFMLKSSFI